MSWSRLVTAAALAGFAVVGRPFIAAPAASDAGRPASGDAGPARRWSSPRRRSHSPPPVTDLRPVDAVALAAEIEAERDHITAPELAQRDHARRAGAARVRPALAGRVRPDAHPGRPPRDARDAGTRAAAAGRDVVLYSEGGAHAAQAWVLLRMRGYRQVCFLRDGMFEWMARVMEPRLASDATAASAPSSRARRS